MNQTKRKQERNYKEILILKNNNRKIKNDYNYKKRYK